MVYVGIQREFVALDLATGEPRWLDIPLDTGGWFGSHATPALASGVLVSSFSSGSRGLFGYDALTGERLWLTPPIHAQRLEASPIIGDGKVFVGNELTWMYAFDLLTGETLWDRRLSEDTFAWAFGLRGTPAYADGVLLVPTQFGTLNALDAASGVELWSIEAGDALIHTAHYRPAAATYGSAPVVAGGLVWLGGADGVLRALDPATGERLWSTCLGAPILAGPAPAGEVLFVATYDGVLRAMIPSAGVAADSDQTSCPAATITPPCPSRRSRTAAAGAAARPARGPPFCQRCWRSWASAGVPGCGSSRPRGERGHDGARPTWPGRSAGYRGRMRALPGVLVASFVVPAAACTGEVREDRLFPDDAVYYRVVDDAELHPDSAALTAWVADNGGWGQGFFDVEMTMEVLEAGPDTPRREFLPTEDFFAPDCDHVPFPVPEFGVLEGETGYECRSDGDCHLIVVDREAGELFEMWRADLQGALFKGGCTAVWDMTRTYPDDGRGAQCTSADAAGLAITPLLFTADEVAAGEIDHALRFVLPRDRVSGAHYVPPATHSAGRGPASAPPMGSRWRLRSDYPVEALPSQGARVIARALQRHGMILADNGMVTLTGRSDRTTAAKWVGMLAPGDLAALEPTDFEVLATGAPVPVTNDCQRNGL